MPIVRRPNEDPTPGTQTFTGPGIGPDGKIVPTKQEVPITGNAPTNWDQDLSPTNLLPGQLTLDPSSKQTITNQLMNALNPTNRENFLHQSLGSNPFQGTNLNTDNGSLSSALTRKYQKDYGNNLSSTVNQLNYNAPLRDFQAYQPVISEMGRNTQLEQKNYQQQVAFQDARRSAYNQWVASQNAAKSNFLSGVLGFLGGAAGFAAGGPAGAIAGASIGGGLGKAA